MSKILSLDDMMSAAQNSKMPGTADFVSAIETIGTALAHSLANHLGIGTNFADFQPGFGGTCAPFFAIKPDQECPEQIDLGDEGGDWCNGEHLAAQADDAPQSLGDALAQIISDSISASATRRATLAKIAAWPINSNSEPEAMADAVTDIQKLAETHSS